MGSEVDGVGDRHPFGIFDAQDEQLAIDRLVGPLRVAVAVERYFFGPDADPCRPISHRQLGDPDDVKARADAVARQAG